MVIHHRLFGATLSFTGLCSIALASPLLDERNFAPQDIITRDVAIIGGGSTGTYSAIRLSQDLGKSIVVVEKTGRLGGHTETYIDPITGFPVDYGVQAWHNVSVVTNYFARLNVSLSTISLSTPFISEYIDLSTGKVVSGYTPADPTTALQALFAQLQKYPYLPNGYSLPYPVPSDLLLPFGDFVTKYGVQAAVPLAFTFAHGVGDLLKSPTLYIIQNFGLPQLNAIFTNGLVTTTDHFNSELYLKASAVLGANVLYNSTLLETSRSDHGVHQLTIQTPTGKKLIKAKKLLITIPPTLSNLSPLHLTQKEEDVFKQWEYTTYYTGIIRNGVPDGVSVVNTSPKNPLDIPTSPYIQNFDFSGIPGLHTFHTVSDSPQTESQVRSLLSSSITSLSTAGTFSANSSTKASVEVLSNHSPIQIRVSAEKVQGGFYRDLYSLQGVEGTFWTGASWAPDDSSLLWAFTETVLPEVVKSCK